MENVQTDDHKCGFGTWLYSDERKDAETSIPALASTLKSLEQPHKDLHLSAINIGEVFVQADAELPGIIAARQVDHLKWASVIRDAFLENKNELKVQTDPTKCALGKWRYGPEAEQLAAGDPEAAQLVESLKLLLVREPARHGAPGKIASNQEGEACTQRGCDTHDNNSKHRAEERARGHGEGRARQRGHDSQRIEKHKHHGTKCPKFLDPTPEGSV